MPLRGGRGGQIKWPYNSGCQARQMLLCAADCIDISLACQACALRETYRTGGPDGLTLGLNKAVKQAGLVIKKRQLSHGKATLVGK